MQLVLVSSRWWIRVTLTLVIQFGLHNLQILDLAYEWQTHRPTYVGATQHLHNASQHIGARTHPHACSMRACMQTDRQTYTTYKDADRQTEMVGQTDGRTLQISYCQTHSCCGLVPMYMDGLIIRMFCTLCLGGSSINRKPEMAYV